MKDNKHRVAVVDFEDNRGEAPLELRIGFSFVSIENARLNLEAEMAGRTFLSVREEADATWQRILSHIRIEGGTERQKGLLYSTLYRAFLWPVLRSDVNGEYRDVRGDVVRADFRYYTEPSFWLSSAPMWRPTLSSPSPTWARSVAATCPLSSTATTHPPLSSARGCGA